MKDSKKSIAIVGCGWLGMPLAERMLEVGWEVKGSTTKKLKIPTLTDEGIEPYLLNLNAQELIDLNLFKVDYLLINIPPGRRNVDVAKKYPLEISRLLDAVNKSKTIRKIIFISSTSVYGKAHDLIHEGIEAEPESEAGKAILGAEEKVRNSGLPYLILRFGGLAGPGRHPGRFLAGRSGLTSGDQSINFLHLEDAIVVIRHMIDHKSEHDIFNVIAPTHPTKKDFYTKMANSIGLIPPTFAAPSDRIKGEVSVHKLLTETGYSFIYPDPMDFKL
jgi:nucleoside-diphosphate-sugar epimerase